MCQGGTEASLKGVPPVKSGIILVAQLILIFKL